MEESDGTREDTGDITMLLQIEEVMSDIRALLIVTKLSPVGARKSHSHGYRVSLRCFSCEEYDICGKKQEPPVQVSSRNPTELACLQELLKRLEDRHVEYAQAVAKKAVPDAQAAAVVASPDTPNMLQAMMQLEQAKNRAKAANKVTLEKEKEKDDAEVQKKCNQNEHTLMMLVMIMGRSTRASCHAFLFCF